MTASPNARSAKIGRAYEDYVEALLPEYGFTTIVPRHRHASHVQWDFLAVDDKGRMVLIECKASNGSGKQDASRSDNLRKFLGDLHLLDQWLADNPAVERPRIVLITTELPRQPTQATKIPWRTILNRMQMRGIIEMIEIPWNVDKATDAA